MQPRVLVFAPAMIKIARGCIYARQIRMSVGGRRATSMVLSNHVASGKQRKVRNVFTSTPITSANQNRWY